MNFVRKSLSYILSFYTYWLLRNEKSMPDQKTKNHRQDCKVLLDLYMYDNWIKHFSIRKCNNNNTIKNNFYSNWNKIYIANKWWWYESHWTDYLKLRNFPLILLFKLTNNMVLAYLFVYNNIFNSLIMHVYDDIYAYTYVCANISIKIGFLL